MLERPFAADLFAVTSLIKSSVNEPYMAKAKNADEGGKDHVCRIKENH